MTRQKLLRLFIVAVVFILTSGQLMQIYTSAVKAGLGVTPVQETRPFEIGEAAPATKCMECHHSELLSRVDQLTSDPSSDLRPAWSPDGTRLVFYSGRSGNDDIWAIDVDGSDEAQLTQDQASDRRPAWSLDGSKIVFDSDRSGSRDIWIMEADGSNQRQLTAGPAEEMFASFSPDNSQVLFYAYEDGRNDIWVIDADGENLKSLTNGLADVKQKQCAFACHAPAWSPDGKTIAYHADQGGKRNIWLMDADGGNPRQLTTTDRSSPSAPPVTHNFLPSWTADGRIIFQAERPIAQTIRTDIRVIDADGSNETILFAEVAHGGPFVWSPDGTRVALHSQRGAAGNFDIFVATFGEAGEEAAPEEAEVSAATEESAPAEEVSAGSAAPAPWLIGLVAVVAGLGVAVVVYGLGRRFKRMKDER